MAKRKTKGAPVVVRVQIEMSPDEIERFERVLAARRRRGEPFSKNACGNEALMAWVEREEARGD